MSSSSTSLTGGRSPFAEGVRDNGSKNTVRVIDFLKNFPEEKSTGNCSKKRKAAHRAMSGINHRGVAGRYPQWVRDLAAKQVCSCRPGEGCHADPPAVKAMRVLSDTFHHLARAANMPEEEPMPVRARLAGHGTVRPDARSVALDPRHRCRTH